MRNILAELLLASSEEWTSLLSEASVIFSSIVATSPTGNGSASTTLDTTQEQPISSGTNEVSRGAHGSSQLSNSGFSDGTPRAAPDAADVGHGDHRGHDGRGTADDRDERRGRISDALGVEPSRRAARGQA